MSEREDRIRTIAAHAYQSMLQQLDCDNPTPKRVIYELSDEEYAGLTEQDIVFISAAVSGLLAEANQNVTITAPSTLTRRLTGTVYDK